MDIVNDFRQYASEHLHAGTTVLAAWLRTLPSRELSTELSSKDVNEAAWYRSPEEHAERMIIVCAIFPIYALVFYFISGNTIREGLRTNKAHRHPLLGTFFAGVLLTIASFKYQQRGFEETAFMIMPCHFFTLFVVLWSFFPCPIFLHFLACCRINAIVATVLPEWGHASFVEIILYFVQHLTLIFFPTYVILRGYHTPTNSLTWTVFTLSIFIGFYTTVGVIVGLLMDRNINYMLSPPHVILPIYKEEWGLTYHTVVFIFHIFTMNLGHSWAKMEAYFLGPSNASSAKGILKNSKKNK